jgi:hypothetical protein
MQEKHVTLDAGRAWSDAMRLLNGQREILLTITGFFILLPTLLLNVLRPFVASGARDTLLQEWLTWSNANFHWIMLVAILAALGRLAILILLLETGRPTVGEALSAGARLLILFVVMNLLIGLMWLGGFLLFVIPLLYVIGRTFLAEAAFVAERARGPVAGIARAVEASQGNGWRIFGTVALIWVAGMILRAALGSVVGVIAALAGGTGFDRFLIGLVDAGIGAGVSLVLMLVSVAMWRQLAQEGNVRRGVAG